MTKQERREDQQNRRRPTRPAMTSNGPNKYGYMLDLREPDIRAAYEQFKRDRKIPPYAPLSHADRLAFEGEFMEKESRKNTQPTAV